MACGMRVRFYSMKASHDLLVLVASSSVLLEAALITDYGLDCKISYSSYHTPPVSQTPP